MRPFPYTGHIMSDLDLSTIEAKASYGVGLQMGEQLKGAFEGASLDATLTGLRHAFNDENLLIPGEEINEAFGVLQKRIEEKQAIEAKEKSVEGETYLAENAKKDGVQITDSGLQYEVINTGEGGKPVATSTVSTHYRGTLIDGTEFDSSYSRGEPAQFPVNGVIPGWTEALQLMTVGSKWKLYIPYNLAYGDQAAGAIPPYSALVFEIELLDIIS